MFIWGGMRRDHGKDFRKFKSRNAIEDLRNGVIKPERSF
jgi:hypothetical protein